MTKPNTVPEYQLEELLAGDLPAEEQQQILAALEREPGGMARLEALDHSNREILEAYPPSRMAAQISRRAGLIEERHSPRSKVWIALPALASAAGAAVLIWFLLPTAPVMTPPTGDGFEGQETIIVKGEPQLLIYRKVGTSTEKLDQRQTVRQGDVLQLYYNARTVEHGTIFSIDGRGSVTLHFPSRKNGSTKLEQGGKRALEFSYELDDAPAFERFFLVWSPRPIDVPGVLRDAAARKLDSDDKLRLSDTRLKYKEFTLLKRAEER